MFSSRILPVSHSRQIFSLILFLLALLVVGGNGAGCSRQVEAEVSLVEKVRQDWPTAISAGDLVQRLRSPEAVRRFSEFTLGEERRHEAQTEAAGVAWTLNAFVEWSARYQAAEDEAQREVLLSKGTAIARERRSAMRWLIIHDPELALDLAVGESQRGGLPDAITRELEEVVAGRADFLVAIACGLPPEGPDGEPKSSADPATSRLTRTLEYGGRDYQAFVYGRRQDLTTKYNLPFHGIMLDGHMAMADSAVLAAEAAHPLASVLLARTANQADGLGVAYFLGDELHYAESPEEREMVAAMHQADEAVLGPEGPAAESAWTEGAKTVLYIRAAFANQSSGFEPLTLSQAQGHMDNVALFYRNNSYDRTTLTTTFTPTVVLPKTATEYGAGSWTVLLADARAAALAAGYSHSNYNFYTVATTSVPGYSFAGIAFVGGSASFLNGEFTLRVTAHELGHNFGLYHANYNYTPAENPLSREAYANAPNNSPSQSYGNRYDMMGVSGTTTAVHFSAREKVLLDWLPRADAPIVLESGTYRVYRHDHRDVTGVRALRVPSGDSLRSHFWVSHRRNFTTNAYLSSGLEVVWGRPTNVSNGHLLIDTTPFSNDGPHSDSNSADNNDKVDAALTIGRMFGTPDASAWFTVLDQGGEAPDNYLDVRVEVGNFSRNLPPSVSLAPSTANVGLNTSLTLLADAVDPDGDAVVLSWDFGDGTFAGNQTSVTKSWSSTGHYVVRVVAVDGKGGVASARSLVRVGSPSTFTASGRVTSQGEPVEGVRVFNGRTGAAYRGTRTGSDGYFTVPNLASGSYTFEARKEGYVFEPATFTNNVSVSTTLTGLDFNATVSPAPYVVVDNSDPVGVELIAASGAWVSLNTVGGFYAHDYLTDNNTFKGQKEAVFRPNLSASGIYRVYMRYTESTNRATNVPVEIIHSDGASGLASTVVTVNQKVNGSTWYPLGEYAFIAGNESHVRVTTTGTDGHVAIDAFKFELANEAPPSVRLLTTQPVARERGAIPAWMRVERQGPLDHELTVHLGPVDIDSENVTGGVATPVSDYVLPPPTVTLAVSAAGVDLPVVPVVDDLPEGDEIAAFALRQPPPASERWDFTEPEGTTLTGLTNQAEGSLAWTVDIAGSSTTGNGLFRIRRGFNTTGISHAVLPSEPNPLITTRHLLLATGGWAFAGTDASETIRLGFTTGINNTSLAQLLIARTADGVVLSGEALGTGGTYVDPVILSEALTTEEPYEFVLSLYPSTRSYRIRYRVGTGAFQTLGVGTTASDRDPGAIRLNIGGSLTSTTGERFDVARIQLGEGDPTQPMYFIVEPSEAFITIKDDPQDDWRWRNFPGEVLGDPAITGWLADPDGDGVVNLHEYAFGRSPWSADFTAPAELTEVAVGDETHLALTFVRRKGDDRLVIMAEAAASLAAGAWPDVAVLHGEPEPVGDDGELELVTYRDPVPMSEAPRRFLRVRTVLTED